MKAEYIVNNNARGTIIWEITGDYVETAPGSGIVGSTPLIDTMNYVFCHTTVTGINHLSNQKNDNFTIYPNPNNGTFNLQYTEEQNASISTLYIIDERVTVVHFQKISKGENNINTTNLSQGLYFIKVENDTENFL
jgi:GH18 family chitinase